MTHPLLQTVVENYTACGTLLFSIYGIYKCKSYRNLQQIQCNTDNGYCSRWLLQWGISSFSLVECLRGGREHLDKVQVVSGDYSYVHVLESNIHNM